MIKKVLFCIIIATLISFSTTTPFQELVLEKLEFYSQNFPEKIYIQTDKPYYTLGDDVWYTAYLVNGVTHQKSEKSKIIHVELINDKDSIVAKRELFTSNISATGDFKIDKNWQPGNYLLRGYTNYMRNGNPNYFFKKQIPIWDVERKNNYKTSDIEENSTQNQNIEPSTKPNLNFYPEGGYLVEGIQSKVAIKIKNKAFHDTKISGIVKDENDKTISAFKIFEFGLGSLTFTPQPNQTYYAHININGKKEKYELPQALPEGFVINVLNNGTEVMIKVNSNTSIGLKNTYLIAHQRGQIVFEKFIENASENFTAKLNTSDLNSGVTHITLFNNTGKPVCERLVFIDNLKNNVDVIISNNKVNHKTREKAKLQLDLKDTEGNPVSGKLSLSITDLAAIQKNHKDDNIKTYLLLNSDLRGEIENPGYFFEKENQNKRKFLLDLVMLTNGWSRFTWETLLFDPPQKQKFEVEQGIFISGKTHALNNTGKNISAATRITFIKEGQAPFQEVQQSKENGQFNFGPYVFYDTIPTLVEARIKDFKTKGDKNRDIHISILKNEYKNPKVNREKLIKKGKPNQTVLTNFFNQEKSIYVLDSTYSSTAERLKEIVITAKKETEQQKRKNELDSISSYGTPNRRIDLNAIAGSESLTMASLLRRLPSISIVNDSIYGRGGRAPQILLDEIPVEYQDVSFMSGNDIEFIDYLSGASASIIRNSGAGVISIYTKTGNGYIPNTDPVPGIISFDYTGFFTAREFYAPNYSDSFTDASLKDIRTTLHWEPKINITNNASAEVSFYTCDARTDYTIEVEGITDSGIPVYKTTTFSVE